MDLCQYAATKTLFWNCESEVMHAQNAFINHVSDYGLSYGTKEEYQFRLDQFISSEAIINEINADKKYTFTAGHNQFSTWTKDEYKKMLGVKMPIANSTAKVTDV
jgi:hypothetical protein